MFAGARLKLKKILMIPVDWVTSLFQQATAKGSRSTILRPLAWFIGICVTATMGAVEVRAPAWITVSFAIFGSLGMLLYLGTYLYCLFSKKEDLLRSETYSIQKLAIERGFVGDSTEGIFRVDPTKEDIVQYSDKDANAKGEMK
jgi:hypothetical protein